MDKKIQEQLKLHSENVTLFILLGIHYREHGKYDQAKAIFKKAIKLDPKDTRAYVQLGHCYIEQGEYREAEQILKESLEVDPDNVDSYLELALCYREEGKRRVDLEEKMLKKAIQTNQIDSEWVYINLGWYYVDIKKYREAEQMFKKAMKINPKNAIPYIELGNCYKKQGKLKKHEELIKKVSSKDKSDIYSHPEGYLTDRLYGYLAVNYLEQGNYVLSEKYFKKAETIRLKNYPSSTRYNYRKLALKVLDEGIKFVCVQYPMRDVKPLKKLIGHINGILFVNNEKIFKNAVKHENYDDYFDDHFAGDFGHCTSKGNRLLAENIADTILKKYFNK